MPGATVTSVDPVDAEAGVYRNRPAVVRIQNADSVALEQVETSGADFESGILTDVDALSSPGNLILGWAWELWGFLDDFNRADANSVGGAWTESPDSQWNIFSNTLRSPFTSTRGFCYRTVVGNDYLLYVESPQTGGNRSIEFVLRMQSTQNYYVCRYTLNATLQVFKSVGGSWIQIGPNANKVIGTNKDWAMKVELADSTFKAKVWDLAGSEPGSWDLEITDSGNTYPTGSVVGLCNEPTVLNYYDNFKAAFNKVYEASGDRVSPGYSLSSVGDAGGTRIEWDATTPAGATLALKVSLVGETGPWDACTNGGPIPGIDENDDLTSTSIWIKQELATSDTSVTPVLAEVRMVFRPVDPDLVEIEVNGVSCTVANGGLSYWNTAKYSGGAIVDAYDDVYFATLVPWWDASSVAVDLVVNYNSVEKSATTFDTEQSEGFWANGWAKWMANALGGVYDGPMAAFAHYFVSTIEPWLVRGEFHYNVQGAPIGAFDAYYWIAHVFSADVPASGIAGQPCPSDTPASGVVEGWHRSDTPGSGIVQGWLRRDHAASGLAGNRVLKDELASGIAGKRAQADTPASGVVYAVNLNNAIELRVLSVEEAAALAALGIVFE